MNYINIRYLLLGFSLGSITTLVSTYLLYNNNNSYYDEMSKKSLKEALNHLEKDD